jgi:hypothetical protein
VARITSDISARTVLSLGYRQLRLHEAMADAQGDNLSATKCPSQANFAAALLSSSAF